jgi:hypothetical protein
VEHPNSLINPDLKCFRAINQPHQILVLLLETQTIALALSQQIGSSIANLLEKATKETTPITAPQTTLVLGERIDELF